MSLSVDQLTNPVTTRLIAQLTQGGGINAIQQQSLIVVGKIYTLAASGGHDWTNDIDGFFQDLALGNGISMDTAMAIKANVWLQAMASNGTVTFAPAGTPPVTASDAVKLIKKVQLKDMETLIGAEVLLDALIVASAFMPAGAGLSAPDAPTIAGFGSNDSTPANNAAYYVHITSNSSPDVGGLIKLYYGTAHEVGGTLAQTYSVAAIPATIFVNTDPYNGTHLWAVQVGGGGTFAGVSSASTTDVTAVS